MQKVIIKKTLNKYFKFNSNCLFSEQLKQELHKLIHPIESIQIFIILELWTLHLTNLSINMTFNS